MVPVAARDPGKFQHQGYGTLLMEEAERIAREEHGGYMVCLYYCTIMNSTQVAVR